ncbi:hypothetical protein EJ02DRAFT_465699 [Clathrospora elynae]|uniref:Uncharacterized protein n=1 Tax=Clathrospora elynae TaxID=706981 RepID=A0A6A5SPG6_9PLEO|nr:hypothetical protein EJ02DRAFT_465699 [Clathrospora elynae]
MEAMNRETERMKELSLKEAKRAEEEMRRAEKKMREESRMQAQTRDEELRRAEQRACEESLADYERQKAAMEAQTREAERQSLEAYNRQVQEREAEELRFMIEKSREEALRKQRQEEEETQQALRESASLALANRKYQDEVIRSGVNDLRGGLKEHWAEIQTTRTIVTEVLRAPIPAPAPAPPPPPPAPAPIAPKIIKQAPRPPPPTRPKPPKPVDFTLPAMGPQIIGRFKLGTRSQPIHPSQEIEAQSPGPLQQPLSPTAPAPFARLGGAIAASDMPVVREARGPSIPVPSAMDSRAGLRRTTGPRKMMPVQAENGVDPKLQAMLAKQRMWEEPEDGVGSVAPSQSTRKGSEDAVGEDDASAASRLGKFDFDSKRKTGWKKSGE